jgi:bacillolysin
MAGNLMDGAVRASYRPDVKDLMKTFRLLLVLMLSASLGLSTWLTGRSQPADPLEQLQQNAGGSATVEYHSMTGQVRFLSASPGQSLMSAGQAGGAVDAAEASLHFLEGYASLFGIQDVQRELQPHKITTGQTGQSYLRYQQLYQGVPILAGELVVSSRPDLSITAAAGETSPNLRMNTRPSISAGQASQTALEHAAKEHGLTLQELEASEPELWIYDPALLGAPGPRLISLVWKVEVTSIELLPIRELVLVDAHRGGVRLSFNQVDTLLYRAVHDKNNTRNNSLPGPLVLLEGGAVTGIKDADNAYLYAGDTYNFYKEYHGRDGIDDRGMPIVSTVRFCFEQVSSKCPYPNAFWNGYQMVYGEGFVVDDVVAHELTHGVTEYSSNLFYYMQSGAINETLSDLWGELVDMTNDRGTDTTSTRWLLGEDLSIGAIRSMENPPLFGQPDKMSSSLYYCGTDDNGGVHRNSGVGNKAASLMADGGYFNGLQIKGIGLEKTAKLWYEVQTGLLTSGSDYNDLYNALLSACSVINSTADAESEQDQLTDFAHRIFLPLLGRGNASLGITSDECQQVKNALDAVEMNKPPSNVSCTSLHVGVDASICKAGETPKPLFFDDLEVPANGSWTSRAIVGSNAWFYPQPPEATYTTSGHYNFFGYNLSTPSDSHIGMNRNVSLPLNKTAYLHFNHAYDFESGGFDGGVVEFTLDGGHNWKDAGEAFPSENGYNGVISVDSGQTITPNPLGVRPAFINSSYGYISSRYALASAAGQGVRFRFRIGTDSIGNRLGWFIDDINIYTCEAAALPTPLPTPTVTSSPTPFLLPEAGRWEGVDKLISFVVSEDHAYLQDFSIVVEVSGCGTRTITQSIDAPIVEGAFSFEGAYFASGSFTTSTTLEGSVGLSNYPLEGCGQISMPPQEFDAEWAEQ